MSRTVLISETSPSIPIQKNRTSLLNWKIAEILNEQMLLTLGILSLCTLLLVLGIPSWMALSLGILLILTQLILYIQKSFFHSKNFNLELDSDAVKNAVKADLYMME